MKTDRFEILFILSILSKSSMLRYRALVPHGLAHVSGSRVAFLDEPRPPGSGATYPAPWRSRLVRNATPAAGSCIGPAAPEGSSSATRS